MYLINFKNHDVPCPSPSRSLAISFKCTSSLTFVACSAASFFSAVQRSSAWERNGCTNTEWRRKRPETEVLQKCASKPSARISAPQALSQKTVTLKLTYSKRCKHNEHVRQHVLTCHTTRWKTSFQKSNRVDGSLWDHLPGLGLSAQILPLAMPHDGLIALCDSGWHRRNESKKSKPYVVAQQSLGCLALRRYFIFLCFHPSAPPVLLGNWPNRHPSRVEAG